MNYIHTKVREEDQVILVYDQNDTFALRTI